MCWLGCCWMWRGVACWANELPLFLVVDCFAFACCGGLVLYCCGLDLLWYCASWNGFVVHSLGGCLLIDCYCVVLLGFVNCWLLDLA